MKKICYVITMPMAVRHFLIPQVKALAEDGWDVTVVCNPDPNLPSELGKTVKFHPIRIPRGVSVVGMLRSIREMTAYFKKEQFDIIQYSTPNAGLCASIATKLVGCRVRNYHLSGFRYLGAHGIGRFVLKTLERFTCRLSSYIELDSFSNLELGVEEHVFPREKALVVGNGSACGVELKRFDIAKRETWRQKNRLQFGFAEDDFVFGYAGRITKDKGIREMLDAMQHMDSRAKLLLVGYMEADPELEKRMEEVLQKDSRVKLHSQVKEIEEYYPVFDCLLLPSYREGFGNVVAEAGALGVPAIVTDIPGPIDAVVPGKTALLIKPRDAADLERAMKEIMDCDVEAMGKAAEKFCRETFDSELLNRLIVERKNQLLSE